MKIAVDTIRLFILGLFLLGFSAISANENLTDIPEGAEAKFLPTSKSSDVRVLIDMSGSMKDNDPENLRIPALNLIVQLLPDGSQAGVWTFGQWVNMLIPPAEVNSEWRTNAKEKAKMINSFGLRTNIGEAMERATWKLAADSDFEQHAILLTDGIVDIAADDDPQKDNKNEAERQRILTDVLSEYKNLGVKIHTIALSNAADKVLLEKLALETGGMAEVVENSEQLVKAFLNAFDKAAPEAAEQVPLSDDNQFDIDESVEEFTALVFREEGSAPTRLVSPSGAIIDQMNTGENAKWFSQAVYDLVTVIQPEAGKWKIEADLDPNNRVTVVSDLKLGLDNLPPTIFPEQQIDFNIYLHEDNKVVTRPEFLKLMTVEMTMTAEDGRSGTKVISDPENPPADGLYPESIKRLSKEGQYELKVAVDGKTFTRMRTAYIQVRQPVGFEIRKREVAGEMRYAVRVVPQVPNVEVSRTRVIAKLKGPDGSSIIQAMPWLEEGVWEAVISPSKGMGDYEMAINIRGQIGEDQDFRVKPEPIVLTYPIPEDFQHEYLVASQNQATDESQEEVEEPQAEAAMSETAEQEASEEPQEDAPGIPDLEQKMQEQQEPEQLSETQPENELDTQAEQAPEDEVAPEPEVEEPSDPLWLYISIPIVTLLLGLGGFFVYRSIMNRKLKQADQSKETKTEESGDVDGMADVSLNDGLDDEEFDEDFDLSDSDDDETVALGEASMDELDDLGDEQEAAGDDVSDNSPSVDDEIPDFDENFDIDAGPQEAADSEPQQTLDAEETSAAIDELDSVLNGLDDVGEAEDQDPSEDDIPQLDDVADEPATTEGDGEAAIDEALASLESELDDIDVDALMDDDVDDPDKKQD
ncbi:VWA domain-containing protein [Bermanella marisrubri]|uniref:VWFA domain-containing protein n=1 Tax=Bermanella marisrubri TaxID=207949 RepID=Q1N0Q6_9GAMM|nr:VWA domain-containing protein [Bermanella marisrubri]EAT11777.1 hypothetical protein RED65_05304 [Oceanobacter sp. RED65] [Bermanella marisrubri]QIZ83812.1 VWA domain-containing protein [Bermanella marisrubri]